jgi:hypothetical protein
MTKVGSIKKSNLLIAGAMFLSVLAFTLNVSNSGAAALSQTLVRFDRMKVSTPTTGTVCAKPLTVATEADVQVTFPTGYATSTTAANWTVNTTNLAWPAGAVAWPSIATATTVTGASGGTATFPSGDLTVGTLYCFNWTNTAAVSIAAAATNNNSGTITTRATGPSVIDTASYATASIADDQIVVTATVPQSFSFALSGNTDALGTLASGSVTSSPTPRTATVNTNAKNGWLVWAKDSNTGLASASASATIASTTPGTNSTLSAGTAGYNTGVASSQTGGTGTITVAAPFVNGVNTGGGLDTSFRSLASSNGTANNAVLTLTNHVAIATTTPAATDYTDTITVVGAGLF